MNIIHVKKNLLPKIKIFLFYSIILILNSSFSLFALSPQTFLSTSGFESKNLQNKPNDFLDEEKYNIKIQMIKVLMANNWRLDIAAEKLKTTPKRIKRFVGKGLIEKGREKQRLKAIELEKEMILCSLIAYRWNVRQAAESLGILHKKIYEVISTEIIQSERIKSELKLKNLIIEVLEEYEWNVIEALKDRRLLEEEVVQNTIYNVLGTDFIRKNRNYKTINKESLEKEEIIQTIKIFIKERNCLELVSNYLQLPIGTLHDRMRKHKIFIENFKFAEERVIPILIETRGNITLAAKILKIDKSVLKEKFSLQIEALKCADEEIIKIFKAGSVIDALIINKGIKKHASKYLKIMPMTMDKWLKKYEIQEMSDKTKEHYRLRFFFMLIDDIFEKILTSWKTIDKRKLDSLNFFFTLNQFKMFRTIKLLEKMTNNKSSLFFSKEDKLRLTYYMDILLELYHILDHTGKNRNELLEQIKELEVTINAHIPENTYHINQLQLYTNISLKELNKNALSA